MKGSFKQFRKLRPNSGNILGNWKQYGSIVVFIHTNTGFGARLLHTIPYVGEDNDGKEKIRFLNFVCHEDFMEYDSDDPEHCPICMLISMLANDESIDDETNIWEAAIGSDRDRIITKADMIGEGNWKYSFLPRRQGVFGVIDVENPKQIQTDIETWGLISKLQETIEHEIESNGEDVGDPAIRPYAFKFKYNKKERDPKDIYKVLAYRRAEATKEIQDLLEKPGLNIDGLINPSDTHKLRKIMEDSLQINVDLDLLFESALQNEEDEFDTEKLEAESKQKQKKNSPLENTTSSQNKNDDCETCNGTGKIGKKKKNCPDCEGTGKIENDDDDNEEEKLVVCETCNGKKTIGKKKMKCPDCGGTGLIRPDENDESNESDNVMLCGSCEEEIPEGVNSCPFCGVEFE